MTQYFQNARANLFILNNRNVVVPVIYSIELSNISLRTLKCSAEIKRKR